MSEHSELQQHDAPAALAAPAPEPGADVLERRLGHFADFVADLIARTERRDVDGEPLGRSWDVEGDPHAMDLVRLWSFVAEGVAAYTELAAGEAYLATARDWLSLARLAEQVGYRPAPRVAAEGWVRFDTDRTGTPTVTAGTQVQASGTPTRGPQTYEVVADTALPPDWAGLTATWVPEPAVPDGRKVRFLGDPGLRAGDQVLLIVEQAPAGSTGWLAFLLWIYGLLGALPQPSVTPVAVLNVEGHESELGTTLVEFDRDMSELMADATTTPYAVYRVRDQATVARRVASVLSISGTTVSTVSLGSKYTVAPSDKRYVVLDRRLDDLSRESLVAVVDWAGTTAGGDIVRVANHEPIDWEVVPGTTVPASKLTFADDVDTLAFPAGPITVYVLDPRVVATHYRFPTVPPPEAPGAGLRLRLWPAPTDAAPPNGKLAVQTAVGGGRVWELLDVAASSVDEPAGAGGGVRPGRILDVVGHTPAGNLHLAPASGNVVRVRHGTSVTSVLAGGDGIAPDHAVALPESPVTAVIGASGTPVSSLEVRLDGRRWDERTTLFGAGAVDAYETRAGADGEVVVRFGDGVDGQIPPSGAANLTATYRVGGGTEGEVGPGEIDTLLGSIRGVRAVVGAGPIGGGADEPSAAALRREVPTRARALDRAVSLDDLADLSLAYPGVSHAVAWIGAGPDGAGGGPQVTVLRRGTHGVRGASATELGALASHLDARRDRSLPLSVGSGVVVPVTLTLDIVIDAELLAADVTADVVAALTDPAGRLAAEQRRLGQALDRSDVLAVVHSVPGVIGVAAMTLATAAVDSATAEFGRLAAERHELLVIDGAGVTPTVRTVTP